MEKGKNNAILLTVIGIATLLVTIVGATFAFFTARLTSGNSTEVQTITAAGSGTLTFTGGNFIKVDNIYPRGARLADGTQVMGADDEYWAAKSFYVTFANNSANDYHYKLTLNYTNEFGTDQLHYVFKRATGYCTNNKYITQTDCETVDQGESTARGTWMTTNVDNAHAAAPKAGYVPTTGNTLALTPVTSADSPYFPGRANGVAATTVIHAYALTISYPDSNTNQNYAGNNVTNQGKVFTGYISIDEVNASNGSGN